MKPHAHSCLRRKLRSSAPRPYAVVDGRGGTNPSRSDPDRSRLPGAAERSAEGECSGSSRYGAFGSSRSVAVAVAKDLPFRRARSARAPTGLYRRDARRAQRRGTSLRLRPRCRRFFFQVEKSSPSEVVGDMVVRGPPRRLRPSPRAFPQGPRKVPLSFFNRNPFSVGAGSELLPGTAPRRFVVHPRASSLRQGDPLHSPVNVVPSPLRAHPQRRVVGGIVGPPPWSRPRQGPPRRPPSRRGPALSPAAPRRLRKTPPLKGSAKSGDPRPGPDAPSRLRLGRFGPA